MSAAGALRRSWKPVGRMVVLHLQRAAAPCGQRGLSTAIGSSSSSWLCHVTVENNIIRAATSSSVWETWTMSFASSPHVRFASSKSATLEEKDEESDDQKKDRDLREEIRREIEDDIRKEAAQNMVDSNYWGVTSKSFFREDGTKWPWNCFKPGETYAPDVKIDLHKHRVPVAWEEKIALWAVKTIKIPVNLFYRKRYGCRAMMLETVAAVPGMVGGMLLHLRSLRRFEHSGGWIKALLDEAENERMHLMTLMDVVQPVWYERYLVVMVQGIFFNFYFMLYVLSPRLAHRITGYLEEEAIISYTTFLEELDRGVVENVPAPPIAIDYWRLPKDATFRDVILALRADEAHHRDVNHYAADIRTQGKQLHESPAPVDYH